MPVALNSAAVLAGLVLACIVTWCRFLRLKALPLPPGPKGLPVLGNLFDIPQEKDWLVYSNWQKQYGDLIYLNILGKHILVISSVRIASDLLEKRSSFYSGRMHFTFAEELAGFNRSFALQEGNLHREARKFGHRGLNATAVKQWQGLQEREAIKTLQRLVKDPDGFVEHVHFNAASSIMMMSYGYELMRDDDPFLLDVQQTLKNFSAACHPGKWLVDTIPLLKHVPEWVPGAGFQKIGREWKVQTERMFNVPFDLVIQQMKAGTAVPSMTTQLMETKKETTDEENIKNTVGALYGAGADTTPSALTNFVLAMTLYPEAQKNAQKELDNVIGMDRLPKFADRDKLPYVNALVKEVLRWGPVGPMGVPHRLIKEDEYNGYRLPKDSIIMTNIWHMSHDKATYGEDVNVFRPERFLDPNACPIGFTTTNTQEFGGPAFGFGRRVCPGEHVADNTLYILCYNILATLTISPAVNADCEVIAPEVDYTSGAIVHVKPFKCNIKIRSHTAMQRITMGSAETQNGPG